MRKIEESNFFLENMRKIEESKFHDNLKLNMFPFKSPEDNWKYLLEKFKPISKDSLIKEKIEH